MRFQLALGTGIAILALASGCAQQAPDRVLTLGQGSVVVTIDGRASGPAEVTLPINWDSDFPRQSGSARISFAFPRPPDSALGTEPFVMFARRLGNAYTISLNGERLAAYGDLDAHYEPRAWKQPVRVDIPASLLAEENLLIVDLRGDYLRRAGLSTITLGPWSLVEPLYERVFGFRVLVPIACSILSLLVSVFCFLLWLQHRDSLYAWASVGEAIWTLVLWDMVWPLAPIPWQQWAFIALCLRVIWIWSLYALLEQVGERHPRVERRTMKIAVFVGPLVLVAGMLLSSYVPYTLWRFMLALLFVWILARILLERRRERSSERYLLVFAIFALIAAGIHDGIAERYVSAIYGDAEWAKYAGSLLAITIMWIVNKRYREARRDAADLQATLAARVDAKERELRDTYAKVSELERSRAVTAERERILRDMHDGVGSHLATAMRQLESGAAPVSAVAATLRESLDHLKLSIDAMNLPAGDVTSLLASLRYRLQPRIESAGLALDWQVDLLRPWPAGTDQSMRNLQFLLLEAISNALQHSHAGTLKLRAWSTDADICIELEDDGVGISDTPDRGLQSMRERADALGAELSIAPANPGTVVRLRLAIRDN